MIGSLRKNQVRVLTTEEDRISAEEPEYDPIGIGVEGLLKSELYGLRSTLAPEVLQKLDRHYLLLGKSKRTDMEQAELMRLANELNDLGISRTHPNPYFELFANAMARRRTPSPEDALSKEEIDAQAELADEILAEVTGGRTGRRERRDRMRHIPLRTEKPNPQWIAKANALLEELKTAPNAAARNKIIDDNNKVWGELKDWLLDLSHQKCWFSEAKDCFSHWDVEHYRPKKSAKDKDGTEHGGYWWLAFDWQNFRICGNAGNRKKGTFFPLRQGCVRVAPFGDIALKTLYCSIPLTKTTRR